MANPFKKKKHISLGTGLVLGSIAAGVAAYLFYKKNGENIRNRLADKIDEFRMKYFNKNESKPHTNGTPEYLAHHTKAPKTDREKLLKHQILSSEPTNPPTNDQNG